MKPLAILHRFRHSATSCIVQSVIAQTRSWEEPVSLDLYYHPLSSFCWKVLIALYENDVPFTPQMVNLGDAEQRAAFHNIWAVGKFPGLRGELRGQTRPESSIIIEYLDKYYQGSPRFTPADGELALQTRL